MICKTCGGTGEVIGFDSFLKLETYEDCTRCHWNGVERKPISCGPKLDPIALALKSIEEQRIKMEARRYAVHDRKR